MSKIIFICHGNICRSTMAEFVFKDMVKKEGLHNIVIVSAATTTEEIGSDTYPPVKQLLTREGIPFEPRRARLFQGNEYDDEERSRKNKLRDAFPHTSIKSPSDLSFKSALILQLNSCM